MLRISRLTAEGKEVILDVIGPGEILEELFFSHDDEPGGELSQALDDVVICTIKKSDFEALLKTHPELNFRITKRNGLRMREFEERVADMLFKDVRKRIAAFLVRFAEEFGTIKRGIVTITMHLSHQEIALPVGIIDDEGNVFTVVPAKGMKGANETLAKYAAKRVTLKGKVMEKGGARLIHYASLEPAR